jgi:hypothetical protein
VIRPARRWSFRELKAGATGISASRRTDIPAFYAPWFQRRLVAGFVEYIPSGPPRRVRRSLAPEDVTHFNFWTKWPRPFFGVLDRILETGYPVLFNITITGLGGTPVEPFVPATGKAAAAMRELARRVPPAAIQWRYDPLFVSRHYGVRHHLETFRRLAGELAGRVDRVTTSFVQVYTQRVKPDLAAYEGETGDALLELPAAEKVEIAGRLREIAVEAGLPFTLCCQPELREALGCERAGCNSWDWACRVYPELARHRPLKDRPTRPDCGCSEEVDIGVYDTCPFNCRYSYASCDLARARARFRAHDADGACLVP